MINLVLICDVKPDKARIAGQVQFYAGRPKDSGYWYWTDKIESARVYRAWSMAEDDWPSALIHLAATLDFGNPRVIRLWDAIEIHDRQLDKLEGIWHDERERNSGHSKTGLLPKVPPFFRSYANWRIRRTTEPESEQRTIASTAARASSNAGKNNRQHQRAWWR